MSRRTRRLVVPLALAAAVAVAAAPSAVARSGNASGGNPQGPKGEVDVQILAVNDFHGNLEPPSGSSGRIVTGPPATPGAPAPTVDAGGVEFLATHIDTLRAQNPNTAVVSAGDLIGASPLISALFHDEPTIEAFNQIGLDFNAVGNHEFDEGVYELLRMQDGGCHPIDGCQTGHDFAGAEFQFLAANVTWKNNGQPIFPAFKIKSFQGARVAFIGMTLEGTPSIVTPSGISMLDFADEADTVNALIPRLKRQGIETIVVLVHEGGAQTGFYNDCVGVSGAIVDIVNRMDDEVDAVISGHTHNAYNCTIDGKLVTSAASFGRVVSKVDLTIDRQTGEVVAKSANNHIATRDVPKAPAMTDLVTYYKELSAPLANKPIGSITANITRATNAAGESALGDVIADAQQFATADPALGGAVLALMNPGGIRTDLTYASSPVGEGDGVVTYGEAFAVQPFGNNMVTMTLTGDQIRRTLEQQFNNPAAGQNRILQVSNGFTYSWSQSAPIGAKVSNLMLNGVPVDLTASYRVTVNNFLADGGDNFTVLREGTDRLGGAVDTDAFSEYMGAFSPVAPGPQNRITVLP